MTNKYGFVYIWYDKKHKRYYIGSHWGTEGDGYVCSSDSMRVSYKRRPQDFRRRILDKDIERDKLIWNERCWLWFIAPDELGIRYYNKDRSAGHWHTTSGSPITTNWRNPLQRGKNISAAKRGVSVPLAIGHPSRLCGDERSEKYKEGSKRCSEKKTGRKHPHTESWNRKIGKALMGNTNGRKKNLL